MTCLHISGCSRWNLYKNSNKVEAAKVVYLTVLFISTEFETFMSKKKTEGRNIICNIFVHCQDMYKNPIRNCPVFNWCYELICPNQQESVRPR